MNDFYGFPTVTPMRRRANLWSLGASYVASKSTSERWLTSNIACTAATANSPTASSLRCSAIVFPENCVIEQVSFNVTTGGGGGSASMTGIYETSLDTWYPKMKLWNSASIDTTSTGVKSEVCFVPVEANRLYWLAFNCTVAPACRCIANASSWSIGGWEDTLGTTPGCFITVSSSYAAAGMPTYFPNGGTFPASSGPFMPMIALKISA